MLHVQHSDPSFVGVTACGVIAGIHKPHSMLCLIVCNLYFGSRHPDRREGSGSTNGKDAVNNIACYMFSFQIPHFALQCWRGGWLLLVRNDGSLPIIRLATCSAFRFLTSHYSVVEAGGCCLFGMTGPLPVIGPAACAAFRPLLRSGWQPAE